MTRGIFRIRKERIAREKAAQVLQLEMANGLESERSSLPKPPKPKRPSTGRARCEKYRPVPPVKNVIIYATGRIALRCGACDGLGAVFGELGTESRPCDGGCWQTGWIGLDPALPSSAQAGSEERLATYTARYAFGLPLNHPDDFTGVSEDDERELHRKDFLRQEDFQRDDSENDESDSVGNECQIVSIGEDDVITVAEAIGGDVSATILPTLVG